MNPYPRFSLSPLKASIFGVLLCLLHPGLQAFDAQRDPLPDSIEESWSGSPYLLVLEQGAGSEPESESAEVSAEENLEPVAENGAQEITFSPMNTSPIYVGFQFAQVSVDLKQAEQVRDFDSGGQVFQVGRSFDNGFALEARLWMGLEADDALVLVDDTEIEVEAEVKALFGLYGIYHFMQPEKAFSLYALAGLSDVETGVNGRSEEGQSYRQKESSNGTSIGFGVAYHGFALEYLEYLDERDVAMSALSLGYSLHF